MHEQVIEATRALLLSAAMQAELETYMATFNAGFTVKVQDAYGNQRSVTVLQPLTLQPFAEVFVGEPPQSIPGPYPCAYVYHIVSEYPPEEQEAQIVTGHHKISISLCAMADTPANAERTVGRMGQCVKKLMERNQYIFSQLPGAFGTSTLAFADSEITGQHLAASKVPYHVIMSVRIREVRY